MDAEDAEDFARWMLLEAKASREGLVVDPLIEEVAIGFEKMMREISEGFIRIAREREGEIRTFSQEG